MESSGLTGLEARIDLRDYWRVLVRRRWWFLIPFVAAVTAGTILAFTATPFYRSTATLLLERQQPLARDLGQFIQIPLASEEIARLREQVTSTSTLRKVIQVTGLTMNREAREWAEANQKRYPQMKTDALAEIYLIRQLRDLIQVDRTRSDVFSISAVNTDPERAQRLVNALTDAFITATQDNQMDALRATGEFGTGQLSVYKKHLEEAEERLAAFQREAVRTAVSQETVTPENVGLLRTLLASAQLEADQARERAVERTAALETGGGHLAALRPLLEASAQRRIIARLDSLQDQSASAALTGITGEALSALDRSLQLEKLRARRELETELLAQASARQMGIPATEREELVAALLLEVEAGREEHRRDYLDRLLRDYEGRATRSPDRDRQLADLEREVARSREIYEAFLQQTMATRVTEAFQSTLGGKFSTLEPADLPLSPFRPRRGVIIFVSAVAGILLGLAAAFVIDYHDASYRTVEQLEQDLQITVIGTLPRLHELRRSRRQSRSVLKSPKALEGTNRVVDDILAAESPAALEMRKLLLTLRKSASGSLPQVILVTSAEPAEGKTLAALVLASELARHGNGPVALVDFDLRRPTLDTLLRLEANGSTVASALAVGEPGPLLPLPVKEGNLSLLPAGAPAEPASASVSLERVQALVAALRQRFAHVVIDSPPCLPMPDPLLLAKAVDATLFVVRVGTVPRDVVRRGLRLQRSAADNLLGILVNDVAEVLPYYYRRYYYDKRYSAADHAHDRR